jgi:hypothetical protein
VAGFGGGDLQAAQQGRGKSHRESATVRFLRQPRPPTAAVLGLGLARLIHQGSNLRRLYIRQKNHCQSPAGAI